jgi:GNAT superfamily N-acetyltransferase
LNIEWLSKYLKSNPRRTSTFNPQEEIIDKGGMIFMPSTRDCRYSFFAKMNDTEFRLSKMAVTTDVQGLGIGRKLMEHCIKPQRKTRSKLLFIPTED